MALGNLFKLAKLTIYGYADTKRKRRVAGRSTFEVMFNPASFSMQYSNTFQEQQGLNTGANQARFANGRRQVLSLTLIIDGTGVGDYGLTSIIGLGTDSVATQIDRFLTLCFYKNGDIHEPNFLTIQWGKGPLQAGFDCRLQSVDINYTSFNRDGSPLRAELSTSFVEDIEPTKRAAIERTSSPDLSHTRVVKHGDTLPILCREIYGSAEHYLRVAEVNGLDDFRNLTPGQELLFPPFERTNQG